MGYSARTLVSASTISTALLDAHGRVLAANAQWAQEARRGGLHAAEGAVFPRLAGPYPGHAALLAALEPGGPEAASEVVLTDVGPDGDQRIRIMPVECDCSARQWLVSTERLRPGEADPQVDGAADPQVDGAAGPAADTGEESLSVAQAKSDFLALLSHEIRTPVTAVVGTVDLLRALPLAQDVRALVDGVHRSTQALNSMIDDLLDLARLETGQLDLNIQPVSLRELMETVSNPLQQQARQKGILLLVGAAPEVPNLVATDPARLRQVLANLLGNAVKFTDHGEIVVTATLDGDNGVLIVVSDTGRGLEDHDRRRLFAPFVQVDSSPGRRYEGAGLGLAIAARLVARLGGTIDVTSQLGNGSEFQVRLPLVPAEPDATMPDLSSLLTGQRIAVAAPSRRSTDVLVWTISAAGGEAVRMTLADLIAQPPDVDAVIWCDDSHDPDATGRAESVLRAIGPSRRAIMISTTDPRTGLVARRGGLALLTSPFSLRRLVAAVNSERTGVRGAPISVPRLPGGRVLLAEDNEVNRGVFTRMIEMLGLECDAVRDGETAVRAVLGERNYDVVLMDVQMPYLDGLEATRRIRLSDAATPILALTATSLRGDRERCLEAGMNAHVEKPITLPEMRRALAPYLTPEVAGESTPGGSATAVTAEATDATPQKAGPDGSGSGDTNIDLSRLHELEEQLADRSLVVTTVSTFLAELGNRRMALSDALGRDDRDALRAVSHTLKSSSALLGAELLARSCVWVEERAGTGTTEELSALVANVERASTRTAEAMARYVAEASRPM